MARARRKKAIIHPVRRKRLVILVLVFGGLSLAVGLAMQALNQNINLFYPPDQIVNGEAPKNIQIRAGGMVKNGSVQRSETGLDVRFILSDNIGSEFPVQYTGILPDLFREGQGILATGNLMEDGSFHAVEVLAKHDENYMPPELEGMHKSDDS